MEFSGEEALGRYLDLHFHYQRFINSKFGKQIDYLTYVAAVDNFGDIPRHHRLSKPYRSDLRFWWLLFHTVARAVCPPCSSSHVLHSLRSA